MSQTSIKLPRTRMPVIKGILLAAVMVAGFASAASAQVYTVHLDGGASFDTRYEPVDADWDESVSMFMTDQGNWIAIQKSNIVNVVSDAEASGFGYRLDNTTVVVGWTYNDDGMIDDNGNPVDPSQGQGAFDPGASNFVPVDGEVVGAPDARENFTIDQFVNTDAAGQGGGIPLEYTVYQ